mgnify:CR=1 FL=1
MNVNKLMAELERKHPGESEYLQAVREVLMTVEETYNQHPEFEANRIAERIVEPDRSFTFKVVWVDDKGEGAGQYRLPLPVQQRHRPLQGRSAFPPPR